MRPELLCIIVVIAAAGLTAQHASGAADQVQPLGAALRRCSASAPSYFIKEGYTARNELSYFSDTIQNVEYQVHIYEFARRLARRMNATTILDIGCGSATKLAKLHPEFQLVGVDWGDNLKTARRQFEFITFIDMDLARDPAANYATIAGVLSAEQLQRSVIINSDVIEHFLDPCPMLQLLRSLLDAAQLLVLSTPDRDAVRGLHHQGPPDNPHHVREWNLQELSQLVRQSGLTLMGGGLTLNNNVSRTKTTAVVVALGGQPEATWRREDAGTPAPEFKLVALLTTWNDEDVIGHVLDHLEDNGVVVHVMDNWSDDRTWKILQQRQRPGVLSLERFPAGGPSNVSGWADILARKAALSAAMPWASWFMHTHSDEFREAPWPHMPLREAIWRVDRLGFNQIDFTVCNFKPTRDYAARLGSPRNAMRYMEFGYNNAQFIQVKAWKNYPGTQVDLASSGGHMVKYLDNSSAGGRVFFFNFLLRHYPLRSKRQGTTKIASRRERWSAEYKQGWHVHYDKLNVSQGFRWDPSKLLEFNESWYPTYFVERLSTLGLSPTDIQDPNIPMGSWKGR